MITTEDSLYNDIYSTMIYVVPSYADLVTKSVMDLLKKRDVLFADGDVFRISNYMIGDEKATVWFPDLEEDLVEDPDWDSEYSDLYGEDEYEFDSYPYAYEDETF